MIMKKLPVSRGELLLAYIRLRGEGLSMADAVEKLKPNAFQLSREERHELGNDVNEWEAAQLKKQQAGKASPAQEQEHKPGTALFGAHDLDAPKPQPTVLSGPELPQLCPKCGKKNPPDAQHCSLCGTALKSVEAPTRRINKQEVDKLAQVGQLPRVYLAIKNHKKPLEIYLRQEMTLGRSSPDSPVKPNIDLAAYDGEKLGVSRAHASLKIQDDTVVMITDLQSSNQTHINGERLYPHETRVLRHGDEIKLGDLIIKILFKL
jgi:hypothetical protein